MNNTSFFRRLLDSTAAELREIASEYTYDSSEYETLFDASDAISDALDLLCDLAGA